MNEPMKILCVDDDHDIRTIAVMALGLDPGMEVRSVGSGIEMLALLRSARWRPDAILLDVMMPDMDGPAALKAVRAFAVYANLPVIFMTARAGKADIEAYRRMGVHGVIVKPFNPIHLADEVRVMVDNRALAH
ncbi:response regulator [Sphingomonas oligoaromativorans]|jgi:CheY-like chemotaxis protein|uniref:response regulator n=1 Tax=Sphingomonas oligoaromativorans TaxID=575322 RepID=UPI00141F6639|nr:response regulator [Sphingomonas oligoaromativorans]NIJ33144.1 CheY-like chemotaxis protein [Sphingomonas oligoaromativorans]